MLFTTMFNLLYGQRVKDPFTMFKVFRRECMSGLKVELNRFDFGLELIAKLVRRGYRPIEIPVIYTSRSFAEGKKVSFFRDPWTWVYAFLKYRFVRIDWSAWPKAFATVADPRAHRIPGTTNASILTMKGTLQ